LSSIDNFDHIAAIRENSLKACVYLKLIHEFQSASLVFFKLFSAIHRHEFVQVFTRTENVMPHHKINEFLEADLTDPQLW